MIAAEELLQELTGPSVSSAAARHKVLRFWLKRQGGRALALTDLDRIFRGGFREGQWAAMQLSLLSQAQWDKRWGGLFLRWARTENSCAPISDILGPDLIGPVWLSGHIEARQMVALSLYESLWPWRTGLTALAPSLAKDESDWALFEQFAKACLSEDSRFHGQPAAYKGVQIALRAALKGCPGRASGWLDRHEPVLPSFLRRSETYD